MANAPTDPAHRVGAIDALRGLALFGVLAINLEMEFRVSIFRQLLPASPDPTLNGVVDAALALFVDMKAFALFSFLFGVGLAIQFDRLSTSPRRTRLLIRRLLALLLFGVIHLVLIWNGDILTEYALAGLVVLPFLFAPRWVVTIAAAVILTFYVLQPVLPSFISFPNRYMLAAFVEAANQTYANGSFAEVLALRVKELPALLPLHLYVFPRTIGLFLVGVLCWRGGLFTELAGRCRNLLAIAGFAAVAGGVLLARFTHPSAALANPIILASGYAALVIAIEQTPAGARLLRFAEPVGRMAFTNYIVQSVVLGFIFYGYGLGLFGRLGSAAGLLLVVAIYAAQVVVSRLWLARFAYGPIEWLWRSLMYGRAPLFRIEGYPRKAPFARL
ncbi:membrane protein [Bradyrhizobium iriomotense]|uniref:Membrane protein n=2 Tax=Bradyrhizobium iriomotense TaxID=441950 RepID=A0ABQ6B675_9BRAD|nr:membrane protein [Bradyrhizobium iriomotense]